MSYVHMTLGSLFDGIGGWQLAAVHTGIVPIWSSEIDSYPAAVTAYHFPKTKQLGDITKIDGAQIEPVDIICAGSPCQNLSQAGNRKGLQGAESSLFYESIRIVKEMKEKTYGKYPKFFVWENVPGAFNSNNGEDFKAVLESITEASIPIPRYGKWAPAGMVVFSKGSLAWRVLDAEYWGVPQRRKRIFLVADLNSSGERAAKILFDTESVPGDIETSGGTQKTASFASTESTRKTSDLLKLYDMTHADEVIRPMHGNKVNCLNSRMGTGGNQIPVLHYENSRDKNTIRKLTPTECERLQGLPDGYTDIIFRGKPAADSKKYKTIGNGMAQPCADYILARIVSVHDKEEHKKEEKRNACWKFRCSREVRT